MPFDPAITPGRRTPSPARRPIARVGQPPPPGGQALPPGAGTRYGVDPYAGMDKSDPRIFAMDILTNPARISGLTQELFGQMASSPAFAETLRQLAGMQGGLNTAIQSGLGRTGLSSSGIGGVVSGLSRTGAQSALGQARAQLLREALDCIFEIVFGDLIKNIAGSFVRNHLIPVPLFERLLDHA